MSNSNPGWLVVGDPGVQSVRSVAGKRGDISLEISDVNSLTSGLAAKVDNSLINQPNGVPGLDGSGDLVGRIMVQYTNRSNISSQLLKKGELAVASDTNVMYVGDGATLGGLTLGVARTLNVAVDTTATATSVNPNNYDVVRLTCAAVDVNRSKALTLTNGTTVGQRVRIEWVFTALMVNISTQITLSFTDVLTNSYKLTSGFDDQGTGFGDSGSMDVVWTDFGNGLVGWYVEAYRVGRVMSSPAVYPYTLNLGTGNSVGKTPFASTGWAGCAAVGGGNTVSGNGSVAVGSGNIAQADYMMCIGLGNGQTGTINMSYSLLAGENCRAGHIASVVHGNRAKGGLPYGYYHASESAGVANNWGTSQYERHVPCGQTTDATPKDIQIGNTNGIKDFVRLITNGSAGAYDISAVGWSHTLQQSFAIWFRALFQRDTSGNTTLVGSTEIARISGSNMTGCNVTLTSSATNAGHIAITVTGLAANTITWTAVAKAVISQQATR